MHIAFDATPRIRRPDLAIIWAAVAAAWLLTLVLATTGGGYLVGHDGVLGDRQFGWVPTILLFIASWQLMTAAMMLPSSLPMIAIFLRVSRTHPKPGAMFAIFILGYFVVWTGFAGVALINDAGVHWLAAHTSVIAEQPGLLPGVILILAGAFQFSSLKEHCLDACRNPIAFFLGSYAPGARAAWLLGIRHGMFCLGCCWALMLTMFAIGMGSLVWMTALAGLMLIEKTSRYGARLAHPLGIALIVWGLVVMADPAWIPDAFRGSV